MARPSSVKVATTENYVSTLDIHEPEIRNQLVERYSGKNMLTFFEMLGQMEEIQQTAYSHYEEEHLHEYLTVNADVVSPGTGNSITFTLAAADHFSSGTLSPGQINQLVLFKNDIKGFITTKNTAVDSAHTFTVAPLKSTDNIGALTAGDVVVIYSNAYAEDTDQPDSENGRVIKLSFTHQIIKKSYKVTGTEATNKIWFEVKGVAGKTGFFWYLKGENDTYQKFLTDIELSMLIGDLTTNTALTAAGIRTMEGVMPFVINNGGILHNTGGPGLFNLQQIDSIIKKLDKNYGSKENTCWWGIDLRQDTDNFLMNMTPNGAVTYGAFNGNQQIALNFGFSSVGRLGYTFHFKTYDMFNHPKLLGAPGFKYSGTGIIVPNDGIRDVARGKNIKPLTLCYKGNGDYKRDMEHWLDGTVIVNNRVGQTDNLRCYYRCERSLRVAGPHKFVIVKP